MTEGTEFVEAQEAAEMLGVKLPTLYAYASRGRIRSFREGPKRRRLYLRSEIESMTTIEPVRKQRARVPLAEDWVPYTG